MDDPVKLIPTEEQLDRASRLFIQNHLKDLREGKFIIFQFSDNEDHFVQLAKEAGILFLDFPAWKNTEREGKEEIVNKVLQVYGILGRVYSDKFAQVNNNFKYEIISGVNGKSIRVEFGKDYKTAALITLCVAVSVYGQGVSKIKILDTDDLNYWN
jgi:hypothetical protein